MKPKALRPLVIVESPFAGADEATLRQNKDYLREALRDSWARGELPLASHAIFTFFLDDKVPEEREGGIRAGYQLWLEAKAIIFYLDRGMSPGMKRARRKALRENLTIIHRFIRKKPKDE